MKLVIERGELLRALGHVTSVVERRTTIPILSNVLLKASNQGLQFKATDLEREVLEEAPADVSQPGAVTVPAHILHDIVRKLPDGAEVEIKRDAEKERLTLSSGQSRFSLQTLAPEDFPDLAPGELSHKFELGAHDLRRLIDKTRFAISTEETRYYLNGIYLHPAMQGKQATLRVYRRKAGDLEALMAVCAGLPGVEAVVDGETAAGRFGLPIDLEGDFVVLGDANTVLGSSRAEHDLSGLAGHRLRSHGGLGEQKVPFIVSHKLRPEYLAGKAGALRNFDIFDAVLNGVT